MKRTSSVLLLGLATAGLVLFPGCRAAPDGAGGGVDSLRFWAMPNTSRPKEDLDAIVQRFNAQNPGISVSIEIVDWGPALDKISKAAASGSGPDVVQLGTSWTASVTDLGVLLPLNDLVQNSGGADQFVPSMRPYMQPIYADSITSIPWFVDVRPVFYRTDVFRKLGLDIQQMTSSWSAWRAGLERIRNARLTIDGQKIEPLGLAGKNDWNVVHNLYPWIMSNGGGIVSPYGDSVLIDSKASMDGVLAFLSVIRDGYMPRPYLDKNTAQVSAEFDAGRIAVWQETTSKLVYLERPAEMGGAGNTTATRNFAVALPPAGPAGRKLFIGGSNLGIFKTSKHQEAARKLVAFLTTDSAAIMQFCDVSGMAPARSSLYSSAFYTRDANRKIFADLVASGQAYPAVPYWSELESSLLNARFANIFDIASEVNGPYSEEAVREELRALARDARALVAREIEAHPEHAKRLTALRATGGSP